MGKQQYQTTTTGTGQQQPLPPRFAPRRWLGKLFPAPPAASPQTPANLMIRTRTPARTPAISADGWLAVFRAASLAVPWLLVVPVLAWGLGVTWLNALITGAVVAVIVFALQLPRQYELLNDTLMVTEERFGVDLNGDGKIGKQPEPARIFTTGAKAPATSLTPQEQEATRRFAWFVYWCERESTTERFWFDNPTPNLEPDEYDTYTDYLEQHGWLRWRSPMNKRIGWHLSQSAERTIAALWPSYPAVQLLDEVRKLPAPHGARGGKP